MIEPSPQLATLARMMPGQARRHVLNYINISLKLLQNISETSVAHWLM